MSERKFFKVKMGRCENCGEDWHEVWEAHTKEGVARWICTATVACLTRRYPELHWCGCGDGFDSADELCKVCGRCIMGCCTWEGPCGADVTVGDNSWNVEKPALAAAFGPGEVQTRGIRTGQPWHNERQSSTEQPPDDGVIDVQQDVG